MKGLKKYQKRCMASTIRKNQFFEELLGQPWGRLSGCELGLVRQWCAKDEAFSARMMCTEWQYKFVDK